MRFIEFLNFQTNWILQYKIESFILIDLFLLIDFDLRKIGCSTPVLVVSKKFGS